jgi:hypothetical protein
MTKLVTTMAVGKNKVSAKNRIPPRLCCMAGAAEKDNCSAWGDSVLS